MTEKFNAEKSVSKNYLESLLHLSKQESKVRLLSKEMYPSKFRQLLG